MTKSNMKDFHRKENKAKTQLMEMGKNICTWCDKQGNNISNIQTAYTIQYKKRKQANQKMDRRPE